MSRFAILLGGDLQPTPRLRAQLAGRRVIAADSGMRHAEPLNVQPELWVGDFDSVTPELLGTWGNVPQERFPPEKDLTDGEIAVEAAHARGANDLLLLGAFGGPRADHAHLHLTLGIRLAEREIATVLSSGDGEGVPLLAGSRSLDYLLGTVFSVIGFTDLQGLTLTGVHWPLEDRFVPFGSSLTLSNTVTGTLGITLERGRAMLIAYPA